MILVVYIRDDMEEKDRRAMMGWMVTDQVRERRQYLSPSLSF